MADVPTEAGWYWWTPPSCKQLCRAERGPARERARYELAEMTPEEVAKAEAPVPMKLQFLSDGSPWSWPDADAHWRGKWGPRIPQPPTKPPGRGLNVSTGETPELEWRLAWVPMPRGKEGKR